MVLQRDAKVAVWGTADPGENVAVTVGRRMVKATAGTDGWWSVQLQPMKATDKPFDVTVTGTNTITLKNVLVGDVWLCSGQSNMEKPVGLKPPQPPVKNYKQEIATANYPQIRLFDVGKAQALVPQTTCRGHWEVCSTQTVGSFSAAAYFFARQLVQDNGVPIGLITATLGGSLAQMWTSIPALKRVPACRGIAEQGEALAALVKPLDRRTPGTIAEQYKQQWWAAHDPGLQPGQEWTAPDYDDSAWKTQKEPSNLWQFSLPDFEGMIWYRKSVEVPAEWAGKDLSFSCSGYSQEASFYFNGANIDDKHASNNSALFTISAALVKPGKNVIAIRVIGVNGGGGIVGDPKAMYLAQAGDANAKLPMDGPWAYKVGIKLESGDAFPLTFHLPGALYNAMIHPLVPYTLKGVLWYQGESDTNGGRHQYYRDVLGALIADWRARFDRHDLPFLLVQLPNVNDPEPLSTGHITSFTSIREAQLATALHTPYTALVITIDIGERDVHATNKQDVGKRLALAAQGLVFGKKIEYCGPLFAGMTAEGDKLRLCFTHATGLKTGTGGPLTGFAIAGADGQFQLAEATIDGDTVLVGSPKVPKPMVVRYAMCNSPVCNLYNAAGLPASPFRSDCAETVASTEKRVDR
jgi:sialate O-acetylesterase